MSTLDKVCASYLKTLCQDISQRCVGSDGNRQATRFVEKTLAAFGWKTQSPGFDVIDWHDGGATLTAGDKNFNAKPSPYSLGCKIKAPLVCASSIDELLRSDVEGKLLLLHGEIAKEQIMPKKFVFYNNFIYSTCTKHTLLSLDPFLCFVGCGPQPKQPKTKAHKANPSNVRLIKTTLHIHKYLKKIKNFIKKKKYKVTVFLS